MECSELILATIFCSVIECLQLQIFKNTFCTKSSKLSLTIATFSIMNAKRHFPSCSLQCVLSSAPLCGSKSLRHGLFCLFPGFCINFKLKLQCKFICIFNLRILCNFSFSFFCPKTLFDFYWKRPKLPNSLTTTIFER